MPQIEQWLNGVVMTLIPEVAGVPADPSIDDYDFYENRGWGFVDFTIDTNTTGGNLMAPSKLAYQFYVGSEDQPLTLTSDLYEEIAEDMTVIPYEFTDDYDISNSRVYLNQPAEEQQTWGRIGLQTIYYGGGEENRSNIVWYDLSSVWPVETAISEISTNNGAAVVYDLQGRRVAEPGKGLYIVNGKVVVRK